MLQKHLELELHRNVVTDGISIFLNNGKRLFPQRRYLTPNLPNKTVLIAFATMKSKHKYENSKIDSVVDKKEAEKGY